MEYASGIFLAILAVAALVNLRRGTLSDWLRAKFLNLSPGEVIAPTDQTSAPAKALAKGLTPPAPGVSGGDATGSRIKTIKAAVGRQFAADIAAGNLVITGGVTACRPMRGKWIRPGSKKKWSEHAWSNAWDLYYGDRPRKYVNAVVKWLKAEKAAGRLPIGTILTYGPTGSHVHIEGSPKQNPRPYVNVPPCA